MYRKEGAANIVVVLFYLPLWLQIEIVTVLFLNLWFPKTVTAIILAVFILTYLSNILCTISYSDFVVPECYEIGETVYSEIKWLFSTHRNLFLRINYALPEKER